MNTLHRNRTQLTVPNQEWKWFTATHFAGRPCLDAKIDGTYMVLRVQLDETDGGYIWGSPKGTGISPTIEQAKADVIADAIA